MSSLSHAKSEDMENYRGSLYLRSNHVKELKKLDSLGHKLSPYLTSGRNLLLGDGKTV